MHQMATTDTEVVVLEHCRVSPPPGAVAGKSLPLIFFDLFWIKYFSPMQTLLFYEFPHTRTHFTQTVIPNLKYSLSLALKHFFPLSGNLVLFPSTCDTKPEIRYVEGDSIPVIFAECVYDFNCLTHKKSGNMSQLISLLPHLPPSAKGLDNFILSPLLALQVTLFPNHGICIGMTHNHVVGDGSSVTDFRRAWALISKFSSEEQLLTRGPLPVYDRTMVRDETGLYQIYWEQIQKTNEPADYGAGHISFSPTNRVRASFVISPDEILQLKKLVSLDQTRKIVRVSSYVVVCAYMWSCVAKLRGAIGDEMEHIICPVHCRARLDPPLPAAYFGNSISLCIASVKSTKLMGEEGFLNGVAVIGGAINKMVNNDKGVLHGAETWMLELEALNGRRILAVVGSPNFSIHDIDFGWGMPKNFEMGLRAGEMSINGCKGGGLEVGSSFTKDEVDAFTNIFDDGLKNI